ncbi:MAG: preprotein translocase subunit YajC [Cellvibrionaceae bacterium]|jgi:preprotein translocase subunit YajC
MSFFIPYAHAQDPAASSSVFGEWQPLLLIVGMFVLMYFMIIRPQRKRQKEHKSLMDNMSKGDEVVTTGGILGKIIKVDENYMVLEVSGGVELKLQKLSIHAVLPKGTIKGI